MAETGNPQTRPPRRPIRRTLGIVSGALAGLLILLIILWNWDWFVPLVDRRASTALHRPVTIAHLHVRLGLTTTVSVDDLRIQQPDGFKSEKELFASAKKATVSVNVWHYITHKGLEIPLIALDTPKGDIVALANGRNNYSFTDPNAKPASTTQSNASTFPRIGTVTITDGDIRVALAKLKTDMHVLLHTTPAKGDQDGTIVIDLKGRYAQAPISGHIVGGSLLTLTNSARPYPIDARLENGPTYVTLRGSVDDPLHFKGTKLILHFAGPDMSLLYALTGIPIPQTPSYSISGNLDYTAAHIRFSDFAGKMGSSDIGGTISVDPQTKPINVDATLHSHNVDLKDLGGFIGAKPGHEESKKSATSDRILPSTPINVPKLNAVNAHLVYKGEHIENKDMPLDNILADIAVQDGAIAINKLNFAVGNGTLALSGALDPVANGQFKTHFKVDVSRLSIQRLMKATATFKGEGTLGGHITLAATGNSIASLLGNGDGGVTLVVDHGGDVSALLPDLMGLKVGSAILSALGIPQRSDLKCFIADMPLRQGILSTNSLLLMTNNTRTLGGGTVNLRSETLDYHVTTRSTSFNVLSFPGQVNISGHLKSPTVMPGAEIIGRAAATAGLAIAFPPAALLPTIQFGVGQGSACEDALGKANSDPAAGIKPGATTGSGPAAVQPNAPPPSAKKLSRKQIHSVWKERLKQN
ncbi:AsmA family protein [Asaia krungthepensis]|uniref:Lipopolysaccharide biogenesis periplasmic protein AsmA n=1 Tax=Asaia krungthepensis NRIC 0535 TaxID=1307925 RepID=A0ABQ0PW63_9PROT|nr:AsmA family protein [Asaia krungthepensis]GBQ83098.1 lipopolysaccharide biogenesis periplasmic protein AsmA [Asaia krungthepensis NRIC 0535]